MKKPTPEYLSLAEVLKNVVKENSLDKGLEKVRAKQSWFTVMGDSIARYTKDVWFDKDTLVVELTSSVMRQELNFANEKIIRALNEELGTDLIKKLILR